MSFANQSRGPFEIDSVDQPPNSNYQESTSDNQQTDTADQQDEQKLSDDEFDDNIYKNLSESDTNETNQEVESLDFQNLFLFGRVSRFGGAVKISSRFLS